MKAEYEKFNHDMFDCSNCKYKFLINELNITNCWLMNFVTKLIENDVNKLINDVNELIKILMLQMILARLYELIDRHALARRDCAARRKNLVARRKNLVDRRKNLVARRKNLDDFYCNVNSILRIDQHEMN